MLGLVFPPLVMIIGGFRWYYLKKRLVDSAIPFSFSMNNYWIGLSIGFLAPGSIGWDIYRIIAATRKYSKLIRNTFVAVIEKLSGLAVCSMIIIVSFPFLDISSNEIINRIMVFSYIVFFGMMVFTLVAGLFSGSFQFITNIAKKVQSSLLDRLKNTRIKFSQYLKEETGDDQEAALLLSFLALSGRLLNVIIGAIILQVSSVKKIIE